MLYEQLLRDLPLVNDQRRQEIDFEQLKLFTFMVEFLKKIVERKVEIWGKLKEEPKQTFIKKANSLTAKLRLRKKKISMAEIESFDLETNRILKLGDLLILESTEEYARLKSNANVMESHKKAEDLVNQFSEYSQELNRKVHNAIEELKKSIKSNAALTAKEMKDIHQAMSKDFFGGSSAQGHWFKCPNGHPYVITECGGAMQTAKCPEEGCGAMIGGSNHHYLEGQQLFSEMDGATRPAWSSGYDMRNFDLNNLH